ncbi:MAG: cation transporter [Chloroflexi bacterium]|nr:cation transporter [Chloroflexota bacterium]
MSPTSLARFAWLSIFAALITIGLKTGAYFLTGSVGLLSDAMESGVNLVAAVAALLALNVAARPADDDHQYGHNKAEYFSSGFEGSLILVAAVSIIVTSVHRLFNLQGIEQAGIGLVVSVSASGINLVVSRILMTAARQYQSITLEADSRHLMTDVWTSVGVVIGVGAVAITKWEWLDPVIALGVALNIVWSGVHLIRRSMLGLLDTALPKDELDKVLAILDQYQQKEQIGWHALRTRTAGPRRFVSLHILVPDQWTVRQGHALIEQFEREVRAVLPNATLLTHLEPLDDPTSFQDTSLDRAEAEPPH